MLFLTSHIWSYLALFIENSPSPLPSSPLTQPANPIYKGMTQLISVVRETSALHLTCCTIITIWMHGPEVCCILSSYTIMLGPSTLFQCPWGFFVGQSHLSVSCYLWGLTFTYTLPATALAEASPAQPLPISRTKLSCIYSFIWCLQMPIILLGTVLNEARK